MNRKKRLKAHVDLGDMRGQRSQTNEAEEVSICFSLSIVTDCDSDYANTVSLVLSDSVDVCVFDHGSIDNILRESDARYSITGFYCNSQKRY